VRYPSPHIGELLLMWKMLHHATYIILYISSNTSWVGLKYSPISVVLVKVSKVRIPSLSELLFQKYF
jgi:hypothetical protein